jgi:uncharacterized protein YdaT
LVTLESQEKQNRAIRVVKEIMIGKHPKIVKQTDVDARS